MLKKFKIHAIFRMQFKMKHITLGKDFFWIDLKLITMICKRCEVTYVGQTGILLNTRIEEHEKNLERKL